MDPAVELQPTGQLVKWPTDLLPGRDEVERRQDWATHDADGDGQHEVGEPVQVAEEGDTTVPQLAYLGLALGVSCELDTPR